MEIDTWISKSISFNPAIISESKRTIRGIATSPIYDRQDELIEQDGVRKALDDLMELPVLTVNHTERPVGVITKAEFDDAGRLVVEANIKKAHSCDDIWSDIKLGVLNSFSIAGRRVDSTCTRAGGPCITKALYIDSITLCGDNRCNPEAVITDIAKAARSDNMTEDEIKKSSDELAVKVDALTTLVTDFIKSCAEKDDKKAEETGREKEDMKKSSEAPVEDRHVEELHKSIEELTTLVKALETRVETIENVKVEKAAVTIGDTGEPVKTMYVQTPKAAYIHNIMTH